MGGGWVGRGGLSPGHLPRVVGADVDLQVEEVVEELAGLVLVR